MPTRDPFAMSELLAQPWAMEPRALEAFLGDYQAAHELATINAMVPTDEDPGAKRPLNVRDGVAHIAIDGPMLKRVSPLMRFFGIRATATPDVAADIDRAIADQSVKSIMLDIDSPGGIVPSVPELADKIKAADQVKPVHAHAGDMIASAAYWVGSQARSLTATKSSLVGSIGVYNVMADTSAQAERQGVKVHVVASAPLKGAGVPGSKITDDQIADAKRLVDDYNAMFRGAVSAGRRLSGDGVEAVATGQVWLASEALGKGLIDGITDQDSAHSRASLSQIAAAIPATACVETSPQIGAEVMTMANEATSAGTPASQEIEKLQREAAEAKAMVADLQKQGRERLLAQYADRVTPAMVAEMRAYGEFCGADLAKFESHIKALPVAVRPERLSTDVVPTDEQSANKISDKARAAAEVLGVQAEEVGFLSQIRTFCSDGSVVKHDGTKMSRMQFDRERLAWAKRFGAAVALALICALPMSAHAALSADRMTECKSLGNVKTYLMKASTTIHKGGLVMLDSNGLALPAAASAGNHNVAGVAKEQKTSASSGSYYINVGEGICKFAADTIAQTDVGKLVYAQDDLTFDETQSSNEPVAGILVEYLTASSGWVLINTAVNMGRTNVVTNPLSLTDSLTLSQGAVVSQPSNNVIRVLENSEDEDATYSSNKVTISSNTGLVTHDFASIGVRTTKPLMLLDKVRFCGNGANATTAWYAGPASLESQYNADMTTGGAGCDGNDSATEGTADAVVSATQALKVVGMQCSIEAGGTDDVYTFQLRDDTADVSGMTCNVTLDGSLVKGCSVILDAPVTVAAASTMAIKQAAATDDDMSAKGMECVVYTTF